jgi:hypothetical protein
MANSRLGTRFLPIYGKIHKNRVLGPLFLMLKPGPGVAQAVSLLFSALFLATEAPSARRLARHIILMWSLLKKKRILSKIMCHSLIKTY